MAWSQPEWSHEPGLNLLRCQMSFLIHFTRLDPKKNIKEQHRTTFTGFLTCGNESLRLAGSLPARHSPYMPGGDIGRAHSIEK